MNIIPEEQGDADDEGSESGQDEGNIASRAAAAFLGMAFRTTSATSRLLPATAAAATATTTHPPPCPQPSTSTPAIFAARVPDSLSGIISEDETSSRKSLSPTAVAAAAAAVFTISSDESVRKEMSSPPRLRDDDLSSSTSMSPTAAASAAAAAFNLLTDDSDSAMETSSRCSTSASAVAAAAAAAFMIPSDASDSDDEASPRRSLSPSAAAAAAAFAFTLDSDDSNKGEGTSLRHSLSPWPVTALADITAHNDLVLAAENTFSEMESDTSNSDDYAPLPSNDIDPSSFTLYIPYVGRYTADDFRDVPDDCIQ
jgi:hypothetical protein